ncbi:hypothetical protein M407DRAFT_25898 [Tulasnella calospora MUT 4182]|uniref:Protein kinase domain-containing protein n=1 Tax=Tulasnella calospora MUT 4182 TaxID=1051891 RepID=A0A0C3Q664_9AGAM|nr:hypothetical protein M407DRAFT_25898 [Tulasnella calospora MUT 4182]
MSEKINEKDAASQPTPAQDMAIGEVEAAMKRLRINPRKVLESLGRLRIERARVKPIETEAPIRGGKADVEAAILAPAETSNPPDLEATEYVAVKKLRFDMDTDDDQTLAPFAHEAQLLSEISHENVVDIIGFVEDAEQGVAWMLFRWERNGHLREFVRSESWELPERVSLIDDVAKGLSYLHGRSPPICHGDLKSLNILVNSESRAVITDFGSARSVDSATEGVPKGVSKGVRSRRPTRAPTIESLKAELTASGEFITMTGPAWTVRWAAPELLDGELPGLMSDIWAFGWICWETVTGNFLFDKENDDTAVLRVMRGDLPIVENNDQLKQIKALCSLMEECYWI